MRPAAVITLVVLSACSPQKAAYRFADVEWGSSVDSATELLRRKGFTDATNTLSSISIDFSGRIGEQDAKVALHRDANGKIEAFFVTFPFSPTTFAALRDELTKKYGPPLKVTAAAYRAAEWPKGRDGSTLRLYETAKDIFIVYRRPPLELGSAADL